jgi:hypothetical protein
MSIEDYEPVADRLVRFWAAYPDGRIVNELVTFDGDRCIVKSSIYFHKDDTHPVAVDYAEEIRGSSNVNRTSHVENCSTSATGRSLSLCGFSSATDGSGAGWAKKPSREEMSKVQRTSGATIITESGDLASDKQRNMIKAVCKSLGKTPPVELQSFTKRQASAYIDELKRLEAGEIPAPVDYTPEEPF